MKRIHFILLGLFIMPCAQAQIITTNVGSFAMGYTYTGDGGPATAAGMKYTYCVAVDGAGNKYIGEGNKVVRKVNAAGIISTFAGNGTLGYTGDGGPATAAEIGWPVGVAADIAGNVYISDHDNSVVRKVAPSGIITTYAGTGVAGYSGDHGPASAARLQTPQGICVDAAGNLFIADENVIRKVDVSGIITTVAGTSVAGYTGDGGPATNAKLYFDGAVATDVAGNLYIGDRGNNVIRKVNTAGNIATVAGNGYGAGGGSGYGGYWGDGGPATNAALNDPIGVAVDGVGNIFIAEWFSKIIRKVNTAGMISTLSGTMVIGYSGDNGPCGMAQLNWPDAVAVDNVGRLYIADEQNYVIRMVDTTTDKSPLFAGGETISTCENTPLSLNTFLSIVDSNAGQTETWLIGASPLHGTLSGFSTTSVSTGALIAPAGLLYTPNPGFTGNDTFTVVISDGIIAVRSKKIVTVTLCPSLGTPALSNGEGALVFPNPSNGTFSVAIPAGCENIIVMDHLGRVVAEKNVEQVYGVSSVLNFSNIPPGNYLVSVKSAGGTYREKILVR